MKKEILVGYTGFVGSNLAAVHEFDAMFNSRNIEKAFGSNPDLLVYAGVPAQKFMANQNPDDDHRTILNAIENIKKINPKEIVLISTIDVLSDKNGKDEDTVDFEIKKAYGRNRRYLEKWVEENFENYLIVRLPGLYGKNLKKNFIYDLINFVPNLLKEEKMNELAKKNNAILNYYEKGENGFYKVKILDKIERKELVEILNKIGFSALNFTDSRGKFQFYNLANLWQDIKMARKNQLRTLHLATEPMTIGELYKYIDGKKFVNELGADVPNYDFRTKFAGLWGIEHNGYIARKTTILRDIKDFVDCQRNARIKLAISDIGWAKELDEQVYKFLDDSGIRGLEIAPTRIIEKSPYDLDNSIRAKKILGKVKDTYGLNVISMQSIWFGMTDNIFESEDSYRKLLDYTFRAIEFAETINCRNLVFGCPKNRRMTNMDSQMPTAIRFFNEIGDYAAAHDKIIALEPNPQIYGTNFINNTAEAVRFIERLSTKGVKINYDLGAIIENNESLELLRNNIELISHIHISEPGLAKIKKREIHLELFKMLRELKYDDYVSIEMKAQNRLEDIKDVVEYLIGVEAESRK